MGHRKLSAPRHGSLGFRPRKRARSIRPHIRSWPKSGSPKLFGFPTYKVGMIHAIVKDTYQYSQTFGKEVFRALTVLEAPPIILAGLRFYSIDENKTLRSIGEIWAKNLPKELGRIVSIPKKERSVDLEKLKADARFVRAVIITQPWKAGLPKKKPDIMEIPLGGEIGEQLKYVDLLGSEINVKDVFSPTTMVDAVAVSKGKGYEGPVARFGIKIIQRKKAKKTKRGPGSDSPMTPGAVMSTVPRAGQHGFHNRVDLNKMVLSIEDDPSKISYNAGFKHYGLPRSPVVLLQGSVPGASKRLVILRSAVRSYSKPLKEAPEILYVSTK
ncbi:MAG: 50S ribosomal protein L3 [Thermoprotei archaeon]